MDGLSNLSTVQKISDNVEEYFKRAPEWSGGATYRGSVVKEKILGSYKKGNILNDMGGTSSWPNSENVAKIFARKNISYDSPIAVIFHCDTQTLGTGVRHLAEYCEENEILVSKDVKYEIVDAITKTDGITHVSLKEV